MLRVVRDALRTRGDSQQHVAELQAQNDQLRIGLRQVQMHHAAQPLTSPAPPQKEIPSQARQNAPILLRLMLALLIGMLTGVDTAAVVSASAMKTAWERNCARHEIGRGHS
jgi:hypothetical protein